MKQNIIEQMRAKLYDSEYCHSDFNYDIDGLQENNEPFFWAVRKNSTSLCKVGYSSMVEWYKSERLRMYMFQDFNNPITIIKYFSYDPMQKIYYFNGYKLEEVSVEEMEETYKSLCGQYYEKMKETYNEEYEMRNADLEIKYCSAETEKYMQNMLKHAEDIEDESLTKCVERLKKYRRCAVNHCIYISMDFADKSFLWSEVINGQTNINGGIIFHDNKTENHWQIHT